MISLSPYQKHVADWKDCQRCKLGQCRDKIVLARGQLPCDILFIGEAPGVSENVIGQPFMGPAGHLLDRIIKDALTGIDKILRIAFTNIVACIPLDSDGDKVSEPDEEDIKACRPRLLEFCRIAKPKYIVHVGTLSRKSGVHAQNDIGAEWMPEDEFIKFTDIKHPAFILRANIAQKGLLIQTAVVNIRSMLNEPF